MRVVKSHHFGVAFVLALVLAFVLSASATTTQKHTHKSATKAHSSKSAHSTSSRSHHSSTSRTAYSRTHHGKSRRVTKQSWKSKGQHAISEERAREIQEALIREHYLDGEPTGEWDVRTQEAMRRYQSDNGWQSKVLPDSRALIKLGLGPDHSNVLNPETAATSPYLPGGGEKTSITPVPPVTTQITDQQ